MIENKELYSYIIHSLDILNRSIVIQEQNTVKLFSYIYNNQINIYNSLNSLNSLNSTYNGLEDQNKNIESNIVNLKSQYNNDIQQLSQQINELEKKYEEFNSSIIEVPIIIKENKINLIFLKISSWIKIFYDKLYKIIFKKKLERQRKEQERIIKEQEEERKRKEHEKKMQIIKDILKQK